MSPTKLPTDLRQTRSRLRILEALRRGRGRPLSAEDIHRLVNRRLPRVHLATVYRALARFAAEGLVRRSSLAQNHAHYELGSNAGVHLLCESCGRLREERLEPAERAMEELKRRLGPSFQVKSWQMQVTGRCRDCRR